MTRAEALEDLTARFDARLNGLALVARAQRSPAAIPGETAEALAAIAVEWAAANGMRFD